MSRPDPAFDPARAHTGEDILRVVAQREYSLLSLMELSHELSVSLDLYKLADFALFSLMGQLGTSRAALWAVPGKEGRNPVLLRSYGLASTWTWALASVCVTPIVRQEYDPGAVPSPTEVTSALDPAARRLLDESGVALIAPIVSRGKVLAVLAVGGRVSGAAFEEIDLQVLQSSLGMLGVAMENTRLYNRLLENNRRLRKANEDLKKLDELKSEFLRNVNHELKTPLTIILAYLDILRKGVPDGAQQGEFHERMAEQGQKLNELLDRLLDFSDVSSQSLRTRLEETELRPALEAYYEERLPGITEGLRDFRLEPSEGSLVGVYDRYHLRKVLDVLVDNAVKFTPQGTTIRLRCRPEDGPGGSFACIDVEDDGPGIPEEHRAGLFESFRQGDGSPVREVGGMGMGLALAHRLANEMGGELAMDGREGHGARFTVRLPRTRSA